VSHHQTELRVRTTLLWRESRWHCECGRVASQWIAHLYKDDVIVAECAFDLLSPMLHTAQHWRAAVKNDESGALLLAQLQAEKERRENVPERRAVPRGGRRGTDPGRSPYEFE
jgi:hypothetical protein